MFTLIEVPGIDKDLLEYLKKWGLTKLKFKKFAFVGESMTNDEFVLQFLKSRVVFEALELAELTVDDSEKLSEPLNATVMDLDFFDSLKTHGLVTESGHIQGCLLEDGTVGDRVREMLMDEFSENADIFTEEEKSELIFQLFRIIAIGGSMNQYEDQWDPLLDATKQLYKLMATVRRTSTGLKVVSQPLIIKTGVFPEDSDFNSLILSVDPQKKTVCVVYSPFVSFW